MSRDLLAALERWVATEPRQMGEVLIARVEAGYELRHVQEAGRDDLETHTSPNAARTLALYAEDGAYRPLKTAPNLRRGWRLLLANVAALRTALDFFYPAMLGVLLDHDRGELQRVDLRETLSRQTGMYAVTRKLSDEQAQTLIGGFCQSATGCLKTILWRIAPERPVTTLSSDKFNPDAPQATPSLGKPLPMLCHEACNLLVAQAREVVKSAPTPNAQPITPNAPP